MQSSWDVHDLRLFTGKQIQDLLLLEGRVWKQRLLWDYDPSIELLYRYLDTRILPGLVAVDRATGRVSGYCFSVYEGQKAVVGDVFAFPGKDAAAIENLLLSSLLETLQNTPGVDRIESQLLLHDADHLQPVFHAKGFQTYKRLFMECPLEPSVPLLISPNEAMPLLPPGLRLMRWTTSHFQLAAELIHRSYDGHGDAVINDQYHSIHGSLRFLHNIVRFPGCGVFDAEGSWVLWDEKRESMEAIALCSTVLDHIGHITQICVSPQWRGQGLGHRLLRHAGTDLARRGFQAVTLTVTEANRPATHLYTSLGFRTRVDFAAMVWQR